jgi:hypothetical protein
MSITEEETEDVTTAGQGVHLLHCKTPLAPREELSLASSDIAQEILSETIVCVLDALILPKKPFITL